MFESLSVIPVSEIDLTDEQYKISDPGKDTAGLSRSIREIGLINPVIVRATDDRMIVVAGFNRVKACLDAGIDRIQIRRIKSGTDSGDTDLECLKIAITDKAFQRGLSISELVRSVERLHRYLDLEQISEHSVSLFNNPLNVKIVRDFLSIATLPQTVFTLLKENRLAVKPALELSKMPIEHAGGFITIFSHINVSSSKQLDIIMLCREIAAREKISLAGLLSGQDITDILHQDHPDQGGKGNQVRSYLKQRRYPKLLAAEKKFKDQLKKLSLKNDIVITPPRDFEGRFYEAAFRFESFSEFSRQTDRLKSLCSNPDLKDLLP